MWPRPRFPCPEPALPHPLEFSFPEIEGFFLGKREESSAPGVPWHGIVTAPPPPARILRWIPEVGRDEGNSAPVFTDFNRF